MEAFIEMLVEMGFEKHYACVLIINFSIFSSELAVKETKCKGLEAALDWLSENPHEPGPSQPVESTRLFFQYFIFIEMPPLVAKSFVCEE